jgi:hypothetical protein
VLLRATEKSVMGLFATAENFLVHARHLYPSNPLTAFNTLIVLDIFVIFKTSLAIS